MTLGLGGLDYSPTYENEMNRELKVCVESDADVACVFACLSFSPEGLISCDNQRFSEMYRE